MPQPDAITRGQAALQERKWSVARTQFETALKSGDDGHALEGLSDALWWLDDIDSAISTRERAYAWFRDRNDFRAAHVAMWLAREYHMAFGDSALASGWIARAERLTTDSEPSIVSAWIELIRGKISPDPRALEEGALRALAIAREFGDVDLEMWALSESGRALVSRGEIDAGMRSLDAAMVAATSGEMKKLYMIADACCNMITACERAFDYERLRQWSRVVDEFCRKHHCTPLLAFCHITSGGARIATGDWDGAEKELSSAARTAQKSVASLRGHASSRLALLRVRQGRLEDARRLLRGIESHSPAADAVAAFHLALGEPATAAAATETALGKIGSEDIRAVVLLDAAIASRVAMGDIEIARRHLARLRTLAHQCDRAAVHAVTMRASARIDADTTQFQRATDRFAEAGLPFDAALTRLENAESIAESQPELAELEASAALALFDDLGATILADRAAGLLRKLGSRGRRAPRVTGALTKREQQVLELVANGLSNPAIADRLHISAKTVEHHVSRIFSKLGVRNRVEAAAFLRPE